MAHTASSSFTDRPSLDGMDIRRRIMRLRRLATLLDAAFVVPGTHFRWGLDTLIGLLPVAGTLVMALPSLYIIWEAHRMNVPGRLLVRMIGNVAVELLADFVPVLGDLVDTVYKANLRNIALLEDHFGMTVDGTARETTPPR
ncbi:DUF4112 domain-containing protein [Gluconacetobacter entanii]|nr:DUF4112 domain-containing protein [Gluconacetobacter entanii]NPC90665.1 DUF4112 domain-containing protein [Gluconacetobacter entanii]